MPIPSRPRSVTTSKPCNPPGVRLHARRAALLASAMLAGCQAPMAELQQLSDRHGHQVVVQASQPFPLATSVPRQPGNTSRLRVYIEGDGHAWATSSQPSLDPSPHHLMLAGLALADPLPSVYLARPCQFVDAAGCNADVWTDGRFSQAVVDSLGQALDRLKQRYGNQDFELIGYSGGAALALLLASQRDDVGQLQTLAGNLSPRQWAQVMHLSPLVGSLEPLDAPGRLAHIPQRHLLGNADTTVPASLLSHYLQRLGPALCVQVVRVNASHEQGWQQAWQQWRNQPIKCPRQ